MTGLAAAYTQFIDVTQLDECGNPVSYFCIPCPGTVDISHNYRTVDPITISPENLNGDCYEFPGCNKYMSTDVTITLKDLTPGVVAAFSGQRAIDGDTKGGAKKGVVFGSEHDCDNYFSIRVVQDVGRGPSKIQCLNNSEESLVHHFACVTNVAVNFDGQVGSSGPLGITITGTAYDNPEYGKGPFNDWAAEWFEGEAYGYQTQVFEYPEDCPCDPIPFKTAVKSLTKNPAAADSAGETTTEG